MKQHRILIVEDDAIIANHLASSLEEWGHTVTALAMKGREALDAAARERPDLALLDIEMEGGMDGIETAARLREEYGVPSIYLTAHSNEDLIERAKETGPYGYILKPYRPQELRIAIEMAMERHDVERRLAETNERLTREVEERRRAEEALRESEEKFRLIVENVSDDIWQLDADGRIIYVSPAKEQLFGYISEEALQLAFDAFIAEEEMPRANHAFSKAMEGTRKQILEITGKRKDGSTFPMEITISPIVKDGTVIGVQGIARDITERRRAEEALRESEERYRTLIEASNDSIFVLDREWRHLMVNRAATEFVHLTREELLGNRLTDLFPGIEDTEFFRAFRRVMTERRHETVVNQYRFPDGRKGWYEVTISPVPEGIFCVSRDVSMSVFAEEALRESEHKLKNILHGSSIPQFVIDRDHRVIYWNRALEVTSGIRSDDMIGTNHHWMAFYEHERPCMVDLLIDGKTHAEDITHWYGEKFRKTGFLDEAYEGVDFFPAMGEDGKWLHFTAAVIRDEDGAVIAAIETLVDVTDRQRAEIALEESERKYREIVENANSIILRMNRHGVITFFNEYAQSFFGFSKEEIIGRNAIGTIVPEIDSSGRDLGDMILDIPKNPGAYIHNENENVKKNGERVWVSWTNRVITDESGNVGEMLCIGSDITERRSAEQALARSESKYRELYENLRDGYVSVDAGDRIVEHNSRFLEMLGYSAEEIDRLPFFTITHERWHAMERKILEEQVDVRGYSDPYEKEYVRKDGSVLPVELQTYIRRGEDGRTDGYWALVRDISARKAAEEELVRSEKKYRELADFLPEIVFELDANASFSYVNRAAFSMLGYTPEDLPHIKILELFIPEERERCWTNMMAISRGERSHGNEYTMVRKDGTYLPVIIFSRARYVDGRLNGVRGIVVDITDRRRIETALRESETRYRSLVETTPCLICTIDPDGTTIYVNSQVVEITGYRQDEVIGKNWWDLFYPDESAVQVRELLRIFDSGDVKGYEMILKAKDGTRRTIMWNSFNERLPDGTVSLVHGVGMDITIRKSMETALRESEVKFRSLFESSGDAQILMDGDLIIDCNDAALAMMGCSDRRVILGRRLLEFCPEIQPDGIASSAKGYDLNRRAVDEKSVRFEWQHRRMGGELFYAEVVLTAIPIEGRSFLHATLRDVTERRLLQQRIITIVDEEQQRLGRNLHDGLGQDLTGTAFMCNSLAKRLGELNLKEKDRAEEITRQVYGVITKVRALSRELYPPNLVENEIAFTLEDFASNVENVFGITCRYQQDPGIVVANIHASTQIYYVVREAVHNALRHGKARRIIITLTGKKDRVRLLIKDNGAGVPDEIDGGLGLKIMKYRMESLHGTFDIRRNRVRGTSVVCEIPRRVIGGKE